MGTGIVPPDRLALHRVVIVLQQSCCATSPCSSLHAFCVRVQMWPASDARLDSREACGVCSRHL